MLKLCLLVRDPVFHLLSDPHRKDNLSYQLKATTGNVLGLPNPAEDVWVGFDSFSSGFGSTPLLLIVDLDTGPKQVKKANKKLRRKLRKALLDVLLNSDALPNGTYDVEVWVPKGNRKRHTRVTPLPTIEVKKADRDKKTISTAVPA